MALLTKIINFMKTDIWRMRLKNFPPLKAFIIKQLRIVVLALRGFAEDKCQLRASALTFFSLLSVVPVVAMAFGIAKGFGFQDKLQGLLLEKVPGQEEVLLQVIDFAHAMLENTKGGIVGGIGVVILFWTVIKVLTNIERSFNDIWGIKSLRTIGRRFADYLSIMLICPMLLILSSSVTVFITTQITLLTQKVEFLGFFGPIIFSGLKILPYCVIWVLFTFIYIFMPNTKVNFKSGLMAGIIAGSIYQFVQWGYIHFQVGMSKYNAIYGSFAALPLFLVWLQLSWLIVLLGAEISFAEQNVDTYEFEPDCLNVSHSFKNAIALQITHLLVKHFEKGEEPLTPNEISHLLEIPIRLVRQVVFELKEAGILSEAGAKGYKETAYQPARDIDKLTIQFVVEALEKRGTDTVPVAQTKEFGAITETLKEFRELAKKTIGTKLLKDI